MSQIISITSEALQATIRRLLPSQQGFGEDLQASNVILPVIDLTPTAEGSSIPGYLQRSINYASTNTTTANTTNTLATGPGFYEFYAVSNILRPTSGSASETELIIGGSLGDKTFWNHKAYVSASAGTDVQQFNAVVWLTNTDSLKAKSNQADARIIVSVRQVTNANGDLINPTGFNPQ